MKYRLQDKLPFVAIVLMYRGHQIEFENVLLDTGSAGTIFSTDKLSPVGLWYEVEDMVHRIRGVGGAEFVISKHIWRHELKARSQKVNITWRVTALDQTIKPPTCSDRRLQPPTSTLYFTNASHPAYFAIFPRIAA